MPLDIGDALRTGIDRTAETNGLQFAAILFVLGAINTVIAGSVMRRMVPGPGAVPGTGPSLGVPPAVAGLIGLVVWILSTVVAIAMLRTFVGSETDRIPTEHFTRRIGRAWVNVFIGGIVFGIVVGIGFVLLVVPGLFLLVSLFFWIVFVAVEDENFIDGFRDSWALTSGRRLRLFLLGVIVAVIGFVVSLVFGIPQVLVGGTIGAVIAQIGSAITSVFVAATTAAAYNQLTADPEDVAEPGTEAGTGAGSESGFEFGDGE